MYFSSTLYSFLFNKGTFRLVYHSVPWNWRSGKFVLHWRSVSDLQIYINMIWMFLVFFLTSHLCFIRKTFVKNLIWVTSYKLLRQLSVEYSVFWYNIEFQFIHKQTVYISSLIFSTVTVSVLLLVMSTGWY